MPRKQSRLRTPAILAAMAALTATVVLVACRQEGDATVVVPPPVAAATEVTSAESFSAATRGFGQVAIAAQFSGPAERQRSRTVFSAEDPAHAMVCAAKRLADLTGFGDLTAIAGSGLPGTVVGADGVGVWLLGVRGSDFLELFAPDLAALKVLAVDDKDLGAVKSHAYPRWLDCFDNAGMGVWVGGGGDCYDLPSDFEWLRDRKLTMCTLSPSESRLVGPGILDTSIHDWHRAMAKQYDLPYRLLQFPDRPKWAWNRTPLPYLEPAEGYLAHPFLEHTASAMHTAYEPTPATDPYVHDGRRRLAERLDDDPNVVGWHGSTEIPNAGILELSAVANSLGMKELWRSYLVGELNLDLAGVSRLHTGDRARYRSWDDVRVPLPGDFLGWDPATCTDLRGPWQVHPDLKREGRDGQWFKAGNGDGWTTAAYNDPMMQMYNPSTYTANVEKAPLWLRRSFTVTADGLASRRYLHIARSNWHGSTTPCFDAWVNGQPLRRISENSDWEQCFDLGGSAQVGENTIAFDTRGSPVPGHIFIGAQPLLGYPKMDVARNRLWYDMVNFSAWLRIRSIEDSLKSVRAVDPDRPLKLMALINMLDMSSRLCERYGAYQHDTGGAAGYWCPMTGARLARSHGLPWSCEQGGPPNSVADIQTSSTFYLMYGNDATDLVFGVRHYSGKPEVAGWIDRNIELLRCTGKMHLPTPAIGILRSTRNTRLGFAEPWNWDFGRGPLQAVGRNFAYAETPDLTDGRIDQFKVLLDAGTLQVTSDEVEGILRYVRNGGVFVAQHHTAQHLPGIANAWPLASAVGLSVKPKAINEKNVHEWPLAKIHVAQDQNLLPSLRGKTIEGSGVAIDYLKQKHAGAIAFTSATSAAGVHAVASWDDGSLAVVEVRLGRGRLIMLGSPFLTRMRDESGRWVNDSDRNALFDEMLQSLGAQRDSWASSGPVWAELWLSKNGVFDLYPIAHMNSGDKRLPDEVQAAVSLRRTQPITTLTEVSALGHPKVAVTWKDGRVNLPPATYGRMQSRVFIAPRADRERAGLDWFKVQAAIWRALPPVPDISRPAVVDVPEDLRPLADGWQMSPDIAASAAPDPSPTWVVPAAVNTGWRTVRLGAFGTLGLPETAVGRFRTTVAIPEAWKGRKISLIFDAEDWFFGLMPQARLWIDGVPAAIKQPLMPQPRPGYIFDVTAQVADGSLDLALEIDGSKRDQTQRQSRPNGVTGIFYLQSATAPIRSQALDGWQAATEFNVLTPMPAQGDAPFVYQQTTFILPADRPAGRLFLEHDGTLGTIILNGKVLSTPRWMCSLDISRLVNTDGVNVLRWCPELPDSRRVHQGREPGMRLVWRP